MQLQPSGRILSDRDLRVGVPDATRAGDAQSHISIRLHPCAHACCGQRGQNCDLQRSARRNLAGQVDLLERIKQQALGVDDECSSADHLSKLAGYS